MIFGFNTDVEGHGATYHVQTEDRGAKNPIVDSMIYVGGKIVDRVRTPYDPETTSQEQIESMVRNQHRELLDSIRAGTFRPASQEPATELPPPSGFGIRLLNPENLATDGQLRFELEVWDRKHLSPAQGTMLYLRWMPEGCEIQKLNLQTGEAGTALASFEIPEPERGGWLVVCVKAQAGREFAKYRVRPGAPAVPEA
jgi:hypothetical protein